MRILGIQASHHAGDTGVALIEDGKVKFAVNEERLTRVKLDGRFPAKSIQMTLNECGLEAGDIDHIAWAGLPTQPFFQRGLQCFAQEFPEMNLLTKFGRGIGFAKGIPILSYRMWKVQKNLKKLGLDKIPIKYVDHHYAHAASAYFTSGWKEEDTLVVTIDATGDFLCSRVCVVEDGNLRSIHEARDYHSPAYLYGETTEYLGFMKNRHEGKVTGLAAYGNKDPASEKLYQDIKDLVTVKNGSLHSPFVRRLRSIYSYGTMIKELKEGQSALKHYASIGLKSFTYGIIPRREFKFFKGKTRENISYAVQKLSEKVACDYIRYWVKKTGKKKVVLAGGFFANVRINQAIYELPEVESVFIHPHMGDGGLGLGAAYYLWSQMERAHGRKPKAVKLNDVYFGPEYDEEQIQNALKNEGVHAEKVKDIEKYTAELVSQRKIVGRMNGRMEYGPRALGNRSILADPTDKSINDWLNKRLHRSEFMPFAPSCLVDDAAKIFDDYKGAAYAAKFMTVTFDVKKHWQKKISAVNHVDNTARPQVVDAEQNPSYYKVLKEYKKLTGLPLFVNTSFNAHEEPIICSPTDAIRSWKRKNIDVLVVGKYVVQD